MLTLALAWLGATRLEPLGDDGIRVRISPPGAPIVEPLVPALLATGSGAGASADLVHGNLRVSLEGAHGLLRVSRVSDGRELLRQTAPLVWGPPSTPSTRAADTASATLAFAPPRPTERLYGLGEHRLGRVGLRPSFAHAFADSQSYDKSHGADVFVPFYMSVDGGAQAAAERAREGAAYGFVWNSPAYGNVSISDAGGVVWHAAATRTVDLWVCTAPPGASNPAAAVLRRYAAAVGALGAPPMPEYATGFIQSKNRYRSQAEVLAVARGHARRGLPLAIIVVDYKHWVREGDLAFDPACWPDPAAMVGELRELGVELMVSVWPFAVRNSTLHARFAAAGCCLVRRLGAAAPEPYDNGGQYLVDMFDARARAAFFDAVWAGYGRHGVRALWLDACEPERFGGDARVGTWRYALGADGEVGEGFVRQHVLGIAEGFAARGVRDHFVLARSAWPGTWAHGAALWSGDIASTWAELRLQVRVAQGVALSGVPLWTSDIGGYWHGRVGTAGFSELLVRWFQFGAFCPLFRLHGWRVGKHAPADECGNPHGPNELWTLLDEGGAEYAAVQAVMLLRERLRGYVRALSEEHAASGLPLLRPLFLQFPDDAECAREEVAGGQFLLGPDWLVAPVTEPGAQVRAVYLPRLDGHEAAGGEARTWIYWFSGHDFGRGGRRVLLETPIGEFPLFVARPARVWSAAAEAASAALA